MPSAHPPRTPHPAPRHPTPQAIARVEHAIEQQQMSARPTSGVLDVFVCYRLQELRGPRTHTHAHACAHTRAHTHACTHARTCTRTHTRMHTTYVLRLQTVFAPSWGLNAKLLSAVRGVGLDVLDFRSHHLEDRHLDFSRLVVNEIFLEDRHPSIDRSIIMNPPSISTCRSIFYYCR